MEKITYDEAASLLECSPRHARRVLQRNGVKPIRLGYRTVLFPFDKIMRLKITLRREHQQHANGRKLKSGRSR